MKQNSVDTSNSLRMSSLKESDSPSNKQVRIQSIDKESGEIQISVPSGGAALNPSSQDSKFK